MNQSSSRNIGAEIVALLVALGIPASVVGAFHDVVFAHLVPSLLIGIVYFVFAGSIYKIWQQLVNRWVERSVNWIDMRVQWFISQAYRQYSQRLSYLHRDFDVKGLSTQGIYNLQLDQIFVELTIIPKPPHQTSASPIQIPQALSQGSHSIWDYLASPALEDQNLVILGAPGSGKSTLLKYITLTMVAKKRRRVQGLTIQNKLPIFLYIRELSEAIRDKTDYSLEDAVQDQLKKWMLSLPAGWLSSRLTKGQCLVLLDGLDEVADDEIRRRTASWVQQQMIVYGQNRFIITSRPFGYASNPLGGVTIVEVHPFTQAQVERFIYNWYLANELMSSQRNDPGVHLTAKNGANDLLRRLHNAPVLLALAVNPLLLTMIATVHRYRSSLPGKRVELYAEICEVFLGKRQQARGVTLELTAAQQQRVLQPLAYHLMDKGIREIPLTEANKVIKGSLGRVHPNMKPEAFLHLVEHGSGLLLERENGVYSFAHLTFQEYLAAVHIRENKLVKILVNHVNESWWHETIRLYCAQADATSIILACLADNPPSIPALTLAIECQAEALEVRPAARTQLDILLSLDADSGDTERQRLVAEALLTRRLRELAHLTDEIFVDTSLITNAEYQLFLDDKLLKGFYYQPDNWDELHFLASQGRLPMLGVRRSDALAFCEWLTQRDSGLWVYRLPRKGEIEEAIEKSISLTIESNASCWLEDDKDVTWISKGQHLLEIIDTRQYQHALNLDITLNHILGFADGRIIQLLEILMKKKEAMIELELPQVSNSDFDLDTIFALALDFRFSLALADATNRVRILDNMVLLAEGEYTNAFVRILTAMTEVVYKAYFGNLHSATTNIERSYVGNEVNRCIRILNHLHESIAGRDLQHRNHFKEVRQYLYRILSLVRPWPESDVNEQDFEQIVARIINVNQTSHLTHMLTFAFDSVTEFNENEFGNAFEEIFNQRFNKITSMIRSLDPHKASEIKELHDLINIFDEVFRRILVIEDINSLFDLSLSLVRALSNCFKRSFQFTLLHSMNSDGDRLIEQLCQCICLVSKVLVAKTLLFVRGQNSIKAKGSLIPLMASKLKRSLPGNKYLAEGIEIQSTLIMCFDMYFLFASLEKRMQGNLPACEGILIVKERKKEQPSSL